MARQNCLPPGNPCLVRRASARENLRCAPARRLLSPARMKKPQPKPRRKLRLSRATVRSLSAVELTVVVGGALDTRRQTVDACM